MWKYNSYYQCHGISIGQRVNILYGGIRYTGTIEKINKFGYAGETDCMNPTQTKFILHVDGARPGTQYYSCSFHPVYFTECNCIICIYYRKRYVEI